MAWTDNLLVTEARWVDGVRVGAWFWVTQPGVLIGANVLWSSFFPARPVNLPRSPPENTRSTVRRVCDARLWANRLARAQNVLNANHIGGDERVNQFDDYWDDIWDELADQ